MGGAECLKIYADHKQGSQERYWGYISKNLVWARTSQTISGMENQSIFGYNQETRNECGHKHCRHWG